MIVNRAYEVHNMCTSLRCMIMLEIKFEVIECFLCPCKCPSQNCFATKRFFVCQPENI